MIQPKTRKSKKKGADAMKLNKRAVDIIRAEKQIEITHLIKEARTSSATLYAGYKRDIDPLIIGRIAKALNVKVTEIIQ